MTDAIKIRGLKIDARVGAYRYEEKIHQRVSFDLDLCVDTSAAVSLDDLAETIDYDRAASVVREVVGRQHYRLIETIADAVARELLRAFGPRLREVRVLLEKPGALADARMVAVEVHRRAAP